MNVCAAFESGRGLRPQPHSKTLARGLEAPWEGGDVLECGDGAQWIRRFPSEWRGGALDERPSGMRKR
jgi:hypothetical protein